MSYGYNKPYKEEVHRSYLLASLTVKDITVTVKLTYDESEKLFHWIASYKLPNKKHNIKLCERDIKMLSDNYMERLFKNVLDTNIHTLNDQIKLGVINYLHAKFNFK